MKLIPEWHEHQYCLIAWPCNKDLYGKIINKARDEVANVILKTNKSYIMKLDSLFKCIDYIVSYILM